MPGCPSCREGQVEAAKELASGTSTRIFDTRLDAAAWVKYRMVRESEGPGYKHGHPTVRSSRRPRGGSSVGDRDLAERPCPVLRGSVVPVCLLEEHYFALCELLYDGLLFAATLFALQVGEPPAIPGNEGNVGGTSCPEAKSIGHVGEAIIVAELTPGGTNGHPLVPVNQPPKLHG